MDSVTLVGARMRELICALLASGRWSSGNQLAKDLGISQTYVSQVSTKSRPTVGLRAVENVCRKLPISRDYFYVPGADKIDYRPFLHKFGYDAQFDRWEQFLQTDVGSQLAPAEEELLRSPELGLPRGAPVETLRAAVLAYRTGQRHHAATARVGVPTGAPPSTLRAIPRRHS